MSNWVLERQQEAFALYRSYLAMQLHFKAGSGFDYTTYGGKVRAGFESFRSKAGLALRFTQLALRVPAQDREQFVFANARYGIDIGYGDINKCVKRFEEWRTSYGNKEAFIKSMTPTIRTLYLHDGRVNKASEIAMALLEMDDERAVEALIGYLHLFPALVDIMNDGVRDNAILELRWDKINKIRSLYYHLGII